MMFCIAALFSMACSASLEERLGTDTLWNPKAIAATIEEHVAGEMTKMGVLKRVIIGNPFDYPINVQLECTSWFQFDKPIHVPARKQRYIFITASNNFQECRIKHVYPAVK